MQERLIEFIAAAATGVAPPSAAVREMPEWIKKMSGEVQLADEPAPAQTIKRCAPFMESLGLGYLIPAAWEMEVEADSGGSVFVKGSGFEGQGSGVRGMISLPNAWVVRTPAGYSTMFLPLLNRREYPLTILPQLVGTDTRTTPVGFRAIAHLRPGERIVLRAGTPLVQAVPVRREAWKISVGVVDGSEFQRQREQMGPNPHYYREAHWRRKSYT